MKFGDFLKATVLLSAASATLLAALTVIGLQNTLSDTAIYVCFGWWIIATLIGSRMGSRTETTHAIANLLAGAKHQHSLPELAPARTILNRLWPLLIVTVGSGVLSVFLPQIGGIAAGFAIIWALAWRRQEAAVAAIEERDGVRFYVDQTSPLRAIRLIRTPGFSGDFLHSPA
ncbi:hypothetical protein OM076_36755 [Solirubrobacter ginsenosidimutans]|uniref:Uncharacterized protein n=1 Tax=Solirubrobacter ginsenosidimutans TaxID=490573 RepID=A0A9X3MZX4_9ACTN|nr:hypothetical protein [Solirubrobacter ginsenosidimutans]MDA0165874.1 hypothetical protein [Solirubrobacter ginsenosidimutans]